MAEKRKLMRRRSLAAMHWPPCRRKNPLGEQPAASMNRRKEAAESDLGAPRPELELLVEQAQAKAARLRDPRGSGPK